MGGWGGLGLGFERNRGLLHWFKEFFEEILFIACFLHETRIAMDHRHVTNNRWIFWNCVAFIYTEEFPNASWKELKVYLQQIDQKLDKQKRKQ